MGLEVLYYVNNQLLTASFDELSASNRNALSKGIHSATYEILDKREATSIEVTLDEETWMVYIAPMFNPENIPQGINGYYAVAKSLTRALVPLQNLQLLIFGIGLLSIAGAIVISIWLTRRITKPIDLLVEGVRRVEQQDFSREVPVTSSDEIGQLTRAFNELVDGLRERLLMLKFVSEATLDAIKKNIARIEPGGERNNITIFFSDIRGFTSWSEKRTPEEVIDILNNLLSFQAEVVQEFGGDVDKFVGDELVAVFQGEDKDQKAVNAAIRIQKKMKEMLGEKHDDMSVGIGINSGEVVMGAMGSENRMDYTVLGNTVNLGARLCSAAGQGQILITNSVYLNLERRIPTRELDKIKVKGIENPVQIYEVDWEMEDLYIKKDVV